jgi:uncharacterized protein
MSVPVAQQAVRYFWEHSRGAEHTDISFYGGEPLTAFRRITDIVGFIRTLPEWPNLHIHLDTNGTLITDQVIPFLVDNGIMLQVSLDGPQDIHDRWRLTEEGRGSFSRIMTNLKRIRDYDELYYAERIRFAVTLAPPYDLTSVDDFFESNFPGHQVSPNFIDDKDTSFLTDYAESIPESRLEATYFDLLSKYVSASIAGREPTAFQRGFWDPVMIRIHRRMNPEEPPP